MNKLALDMFRQMITHLKRGNTKGVYSNAKPIFILSLIEYVPYLRDNTLKWAERMFEMRYFSNFEKYDSNKPTPIWKPFYYLSSEPFYNLVWNNHINEALLKRPSSKTLRDYLDYAKLDDDLWELLQEDKNREYLKNCIIEQYFTTK